MVNEKKTLVIAAIGFPPILIGTAIQMGNLFRHFPKNSYHVLTGRLDHTWPPIDKDSMMPAPYTFTRFPLFIQGSSWRWRIRNLLQNLFALLEITWKGLRIIHREKIDTIFVVADHYVELAALVLHWLTGNKIVLWLPDLYYIPENLKIGWTQTADRLIESFLLKKVDTVLVTAEATQEYYAEKYGIDTEVLPHTVDISKYGSQHEHYRSENRTTKIFFTGTVEPCNFGPLLDMIKVVNKNPELNLELSIISNNLSKDFKEICENNHRITYGHAKREEIPVLQQSADILFLPLSFEEHGYCHHSIVRTASPSKLPEYLIAGRPILVYAPAKSYYAEYARQEGFALIVDKPDCSTLRCAILELLNNADLRYRLVTAAKKTAEKYHDAKKVSARLQSMLGIIEKPIALQRS